jgi:hypothetical protein
LFANNLAAMNYCHRDTRYLALFHLRNDHIIDMITAHSGGGGEADRYNLSNDIHA